MSRIGKLPVTLPEKVDANITDNKIEIKWPKWNLDFNFSPLLSVNINDNKVVITPLNAEDSASKAIWGTTRAIIANMVEWVTNGHQKSLEINWVWYKFDVQWNKLILSIWYSHKVEMVAPKWIEIKIDEKAKNILHIFWLDKQLVWEFAAKIRAKKKPEPYKGKWIKYVWEYIRRKAWKSGK